MRVPSVRIGYDTSLISPVLHAELATFQLGGSTGVWIGGRLQPLDNLEAFAPLAALTADVRDDKWHR